MFQQDCIIKPSLFNATSAMHRRLIEGRHLVFISLLVQSGHFYLFYHLHAEINPLLHEFFFFRQFLRYSL